MENVNQISLFKKIIVDKSGMNFGQSLLPICPDNIQYYDHDLQGTSYQENKAFRMRGKRLSTYPGKKGYKIHERSRSCQSHLFIVETPEVVTESLLQGVNIRSGGKRGWKKVCTAREMRVCQVLTNGDAMRERENNVGYE